MFKFILIKKKPPINTSILLNLYILNKKKPIYLIFKFFI